MANCTHCGCNKLSCGCKDSYLTTPPACPTPVDCPAAQPCSETFDSQCIIYTGADILCGLETVIQQDDTVAEAIKNIIDYFCYKTTVASPILCGTDTVVLADTPIINALNDTIDYFCQQVSNIYNNMPNTIAVGGENIAVTSNTVGITTTYTVNSLGLNSFVAGLTINSTRQPLDGIIPAVNPSTVGGLTSGQIINKFNYVISNNTMVQATVAPGAYVANGSLPACSFGTFDNETTGEFTITETGMYLVQGSCHLKADDNSSLFWQTGSNPGSFGIGLLNTGNNLQGGQYQTTIPSVNKHVDICADVLNYFTSGTVLRLSVLNLTDRSYNGNSYSGGDTIKFSITQIRTL